MKMRRLKSVPKFAQPAAEKINRAARVLDRGLVVDSGDVVAERQPDGRVKLYLHPRFLLPG